MKTPNTTTSVVLALAAFAASCATVPVTEGEEELPVIAQTWIFARDPLTGIILPNGNVEPVDGVACTLRNDKGTWTATSGSEQGSTRTVRVQRSTKPLEAVCAKDGYHTVRASLACLSPRQRSNSMMQGYATIYGAGALAILAVFPPGLVMLSPQLALLGVQAAYTSSRGDEYDRCTYGAIMPTMSRTTDAAPQLGPLWKPVASAEARRP